MGTPAAIRTHAAAEQELVAISQDLLPQDPAISAKIAAARKELSKMWDRHFADAHPELSKFAPAPTDPACKEIEDGFVKCQEDFVTLQDRKRCINDVVWKACLKMKSTKAVDSRSVLLSTSSRLSSAVEDFGALDWKQR